MNKVIIALLLVFVFVFMYSTKSTFGDRNKTKSSDIIYERFKNRFTIVKNNKTLNGVDMVYVITMPKRKAYITEQINKLGVTARYFNAVTPDDLSENDYNTLSNINEMNSDIYHKYTRLAVLLSFIMCFIDSLKQGYSTIVVFEDDILINVKHELLNESLMEFQKSPLDVFYMGYCFLNCGQLLYLNKYSTLVELSDRNLLCCHSMCIKTRILPGLIDFCFPMRNNSDELFRNYYILAGVRVCVPRSVYFTQNRTSLESLNESIEDPQLFKTCKF
jgi:hypothetical protein